MEFMLMFKKFLPIKVHHIYFSYGWWWKNKLYFLSKIDGLSIVPMEKEIGDYVYAKNGKLVEHGDTISWKRYEEQFL